MIHPNMATMLCFLTTDAPVDQTFLKASLKEAVHASFNMVDIDSDTSTNDMAIVLANGLAGGAAIAEGHPDASTFQKALTLVCTSMARMMVQDAEGGTKLIEAKVEGAASLGDARRRLATAAPHSTCPRQSFSWRARLAANCGCSATARHNRSTWPPQRLAWLRKRSGSVSTSASVQLARRPGAPT
jgi:ribosomal protein L37E